MTPPGVEEGFKIGLSWQLLGLFLLLVLNAAFVAAEFALVRLRETQLHPLLKKGHKRAAIAQRLIQNIESCLSATQLGITLCGLGIGGMTATVFADLLAPVFEWLRIHSQTLRTIIASLFGMLVNSLVVIVAGELVPKAVAIRRTLTTALWIAQPLDWFYRISYPFIWLLNRSAQWILNMLGINPGGAHGEGQSEEELRLMLASSMRPGSDGAFGRNVVLNAFDLRRRVVREVMRPRSEIASLNTRASMDQCLEVAEQTRFSRFPLCEEADLDRTLGLVHIKDLYALRRQATTGADLAPVARGLVYVPASARLEFVLRLLLDRKLHMAIVVDEYGGTVGLITLENILEELVGQIQDEFDHEKPLLTRLDQHTWEASGALALHDLEELLAETLHSEGSATVSGFMTERLGGFPKEGDSLTIGAFVLVVEQTEGPRVEKLKVIRSPG